MSEHDYGVHASPPLRISVLAAAQHIAPSAVTLIFPRIIADAAGADTTLTAHYGGLAMVAMGLGTLIQAYGRHGIGSGYLLLGHCTILYVPLAVEAAHTGGLGAVAGLTMVAGISEIILSRVVRRIRGYLPTEVVGIVILMLGVLLGELGVKLMISTSGVGGASRYQWIPAGIALLTIVSVAVWARSTPRSLAVLIGVVTGCLSSWLLFATLGGTSTGAPQLAILTPLWPLATPRFPTVYMSGFIIASIACFIRATADIVACQQLTDPNWKRANYKSIAAGTLADGIGCLIAGIIGVLGTNTYSGSVGLAAATGIKSRRVAMLAGVGWISLGILPGAASLVAMIPAGVLGAACFFAATFTVKIGANMATQRLLDTKRIFTVGAALVIGLLYDDLNLHGRFAGSLPSTFGSPLILAMTTAILLNLVFRIGVSGAKNKQWKPADGIPELRNIIEDCGREWGARADAIARAANFLEEFERARRTSYVAGRLSTSSLASTRFASGLNWSGRARPCLLGTPRRRISKPIMRRSPRP
jgi:xanthine permease XanP